MGDTILQESREQKPIYWSTVCDETSSLFVEYIHIDASDPTGNEAPAARWLGAILGLLNQA